MRIAFLIVKRFIATISFFVIVGMVSFFIWVFTGPRDLGIVVPYIESQITDLNKNFEIRLETGVIHWDKAARAIRITFDNVSYLTTENELVADVPKMVFDFSLLRFLRGQLLAPSILMHKPKFYINTAFSSIYDSDEQIKQTEDESRKSQLKREALFRWLYENLEDLQPNLTIHNIQFDDADIFISNGQSDLLWHVKRGYVGGEVKNDERHLVAKLIVDFTGYESTFEIRATPLDKRELSIAFSFQDLPSNLLQDIDPDYFELSQHVQLVAGGKLQALVAPDLSFNQLLYNIDYLHGKVNLPEFFEKEFVIRSFQSMGSFYDDFDTLVIDHAQLDSNGPVFDLAGTFRQLHTSENGHPAVDVELGIEHLPVDEISEYWPVNVSSISRKWMIERISNGMIKNAKAHFIASPEQLESLAQWRTVFQGDQQNWDQLFIPTTKEMLSASLEVEGMNLLFSQDHPPLRELNTQIEIDGHDMVATIFSGKILDSPLTKGKITMGNLWMRPMTLKATAQIEGLAQDLIYFAKSSLEKNTDSSLVKSILNAKGEALSEISIVTPLSDQPVLYDEMDLSVISELNNLYLPKFVEGFDVYDGKLKLTMGNYDLQVEGNVTIDETPINAKAEYYFAPDFQGEFDFLYELQGEVTPALLTKLNILEGDYIKGNIGIDVAVKENNLKRLSTGSVTLDDAAIEVAALGYTKAEKEPLSLGFSITEDRAKNLMHVKNLTAKGNNILIKGNLELEKNPSQVISAQFDDFQIGNTDVAVKYNLKPNESMSISLQGKRLDLSDVAFGEWSKKRRGNAIAQLVDIDIATVDMKNGVALSDVKVDVDCPAKQCSSVQLHAKMADDYFVVMSMKPLGDRSSLMMESDNAGLVLKALDISKHVEEGRLQLETTFINDEEGELIARGLFNILDFKAVKTPTLGKLFTLASFRGIADILNQKGISFQSFKFPFEIRNNVIYIKEGRSTGSSVGLTAEGTLDMNKKWIDINGAVVPANEINRVLGNIPLIGPVLIGRKNEGVIAANYRIKGKFGKTEISVNPLSVLAPGILRKWFMQ